MHRSTLAIHIDTLTRTARACVASADDCTWEVLSIDSITLPERKDGVTMVCKPQRHKNCGPESYVLRQSEACNYTVNSGTDAVCGVTYASKTSANCGVNLTHSIFMWPKRATTAAVKLALCQAKGYQMTTGRIGCHFRSGGHCTYEPNNNEFLECGNYKTCRHEKHGIESINTCINEKFGRTYEACRHKSHGVELHKMCNINLDTGEKCDEPTPMLNTLNLSTQ